MRFTDTIHFIHKPYQIEMFTSKSFHLIQSSVDESEWANDRERIGERKRDTENFNLTTNSNIDITE